MTIIAIMFFGLLALPWLLDARDAWRHRRVVRRECRLLDQELEMLT